MKTRLLRDLILVGACCVCRVAALDDPPPVSSAPTHTRTPGPAASLSLPEPDLRLELSDSWVLPCEWNRHLESTSRNQRVPPCQRFWVRLAIVATAEMQCFLDGTVILRDRPPLHGGVRGSGSEMAVFGLDAL